MQQILCAETLKRWTDYKSRKGIELGNEYEMSLLNTARLTGLEISDIYESVEQETLDYEVEEHRKVVEEVQKAKKAHKFFEKYRKGVL
jgi:hypothetical protein